MSVFPDPPSKESERQILLGMQKKILRAVIDAVADGSRETAVEIPYSPLSPRKWIDVMTPYHRDHGLFDEALDTLGRAVKQEAVT